jgi:putative ABC transport system permease protein
MIKNFFIATVRELRANYTNNFINIFGLSIGIAVFILIIQYATFQLSYDRFHSNADNIYRVASIRGKEARIAKSGALVGPALKQSFAEVDNYVRLMPWRALVRHKDESFAEDKIFRADASFFKIFDFELVNGNKDNCLTAANAVVISERVAEKYFKDADPLGETMQLDGADYEVTGVVKVPENSHLQFDLLLSFPDLDQFQQGRYLGRGGWGLTNFYTYVLLQPGVEKEALEAKLGDFVKSECIGDCGHENIFLQPIKDIHLYSDLQFEAGPNGDGTTVEILITLSILILIVAWRWR